MNLTALRDAERLKPPLGPGGVPIGALRIHENNPVRRNALTSKLCEQLKEALVRTINRNNHIEFCLSHY